jgi:hypothetical protein
MPTIRTSPCLRVRRVFGRVGPTHRRAVARGTRVSRELIDEVSWPASSSCFVRSQRQLLGQIGANPCLADRQNNTFDGTHGLGGHIGRIGLGAVDCGASALLTRYILFLVTKLPSVGTLDSHSALITHPGQDNGRVGLFCRVAKQRMEWVIRRKRPLQAYLVGR